MSAPRKFGVGGAGVGRTVWRVADNLVKTLLCKFLFLLAIFFLIRYVGFHMNYNREPSN